MEIPEVFPEIKVEPILKIELKEERLVEPVKKVVKPFPRGIKISNAILENNGKRITNRIEVPTPLRYFFKDFNFFVEYEEDVSNIPLGVLNIPAMATIIHFAWVVGCDMYIPELDATYLTGLGKIKKIFERIPLYNALLLNNEVYVENITSSEFEKTGKRGLLFSGGLDSSAARIRNTPDFLISVWGLDIPLDWDDFWQRFLKVYQDGSLLPIKSNTLELYDLGRLYGELGQSFTVEYWPSIAYSIVPFGLAAPIVSNKVDALMMASTFPLRYYSNPDLLYGKYTPKVDFSYASYRPHYFLDQHLGWGNIETYDVDNEYDRPEKVEYIIKPYIEENGPFLIRSCGHRTFLDFRPDKEKLNCGICKKCLLTAATLCNSGIDPRDCGFDIREYFFETIKNNILSKRFNYPKEQLFWGEVQRMIPARDEDISTILPGSKEFFEWLRDYKL